MHAIFSATEARIKQWQELPEVLGVLLVGSKSHEHDDELSDDDLEVLLSDEAFDQLAPTQTGEIYFEGEAGKEKLLYDAQYTTLTDLQRKQFSPHDLDRWPYEHAVVLFDRSGQVAPLVKAIGTMPADFRHRRLLHGTIDAWIAPYRAQKTLKRNAPGAARLIVARGAKALVRLLFALEWRWVPLDHWLEAELNTLQDPTQAGPLVILALTTGNPQFLEEALNKLEERLTQEGIAPRSQWRNVFYELLHTTNTQDRSIHGLY